MAFWFQQTIELAWESLKKSPINIPPDMFILGMLIPSICVVVSSAYMLLVNSSETAKILLTDS